jgi:hypothetical protein
LIQHFRALRILNSVGHFQLLQMLQLAHQPPSTRAPSLTTRTSLSLSHTSVTHTSSGSAGAIGFTSTPAIERSTSPAISAKYLLRSRLRCSPITATPNRTSHGACASPSKKIARVREKAPVVGRLTLRSAQHQQVLHVILQPLTPTVR